MTTYLITRSNSFAGPDTFSFELDGEYLFRGQKFHDQAAAVREAQQCLLAARGIYVKLSDIKVRGDAAMS